MLIYLNPTGTAVLHVQTHYPEGHGAAMKKLGENVVEIEEMMDIEEIGIHPDGSIYKLARMGLEPSSRILLGETAHIAGIPAGAFVSINGAGAIAVEVPLELEPDVAGTYRLLFTAEGYVPQEVSLEVANHS